MSTRVGVRTPQAMGQTKVRLPFDGCASTDPGEVRAPRRWPVAVVALGLLLVAVLLVLGLCFGT